MRYRLAAVAAAALTLTAAAPAAASAWLGASGHGTKVPAAGACTQNGSINWDRLTGPPAALTSWFTNNPCSQYQSPAIIDTGGSWHYGTWRTAVGVDSTASSPNQMARGYLRYKNTSNGQRYCWKKYPTDGGSWFACDSTPGS